MTAGSATGIAVITQMQPMSVLFRCRKTRWIRSCQKSATATKLVAVAYDRANVKKLATGAVSVLDNQVDTTTGMVKLRANFDNSDEALFPNQFVNIRLLVDTLQDASPRRPPPSSMARRAITPMSSSTARPPCAC